MKRFRFLLALLIVWLPGCSSALEDRTSAETAEPSSITSWDVSLQQTLQEVERLQSQAMTQTDMNHTAFLELEVLEAALFMAMARYEETCSPGRRAALVQDHEAWLERRNAAAAEERSAHEGGTIAPLIEATEMSDWTQYRISAINALHARGADCESPTSDRTAWRLTNAGLMEGDAIILDESVPFTVDNVRAVLPAGSVSEGIHEDEGGTRPILLLSHGLEFMGRIYGSGQGTVAALEILLAGVSDPEEAAIGWPMSYLRPERFTCLPGMEHHSGDAICTDDKYPNISYVFRPDDWNGPDGILPEQDILNDWTLWSMYWTAPDASEE